MELYANDEHGLLILLCSKATLFFVDPTYATCSAHFPERTARKRNHNRAQLKEIMNYIRFRRIFVSLHSLGIVPCSAKTNIYFQEAIICKEAKKYTRLLSIPMWKIHQLKLLTDWLELLKLIVGSNYLWGIDATVSPNIVVVIQKTTSWLKKYSHLPICRLGKTTGRSSQTRASNWRPAPTPRKSMTSLFTTNPISVCWIFGRKCIRRRSKGKILLIWKRLGITSSTCFATANTSIASKSKPPTRWYWPLQQRKMTRQLRSQEVSVFVLLCQSSDRRYERFL